jgi:hypothetical protein
MIVASHLAPIRASAAVADGGHLASRSECAPRRAFIALETRNAPFVRQLGKPSPAARIAAYAVNMTTIAQRSNIDIAQRSNIEHEVHHLAAKLRIFRFELIKQSFIPWASPVVLAS